MIHVKVTVFGEVDASNAQTVAGAVAGAFVAGVPITVDLSGVTFFDAAGVRACLAIDATARAFGISWTLKASPAVARTLTVTKVADVLPIVSDANGATF